MQADVFHFHDWYGGVALESLFRSGHRGIVFTSHLPLRRGFTYRDAGMTWNQKYLLEDRSIRAARMVTAPSAYVQRFLIDEYGLPEDRTEVVPHGVDLANFAPQSLAPTGGVRLLSVGRMTEQKGFGLLVRAFPRILASEPDASLTLIGDGGQRDSLACLIDRLDLNSAVKLLPTQSKTELAMAYAQADLLVMPSQFEPFGLVGLEAMACGCPVHALRPSGAQEYLLAGEMSDSYSPPRLAQAIIQRIQGLRQANGVAGSIRLRAEAFTWERAARSYERIYLESIR